MREPLPAPSSPPPVLSPLPPEPPRARVEPVARTIHGETLVDPYAWLQQRDAPEMRAHLEAENDYTEAVMRPLVALRETLYAEMRARLAETRQTVPYRDGDYWYYERTEEGRQYPLRCRRRSSMDAPEEVLLDLDALANGQPYLGLGAFAVSDDGARLAYTLDGRGSREHVLTVRDLRDGHTLLDGVTGVASLAWAADGETLCYVTQDATKRPHRLWRHRLGASAGEPVYEETDARYRLSVRRTRSRRFLVATSASSVTTEVRLLPAGEPEDAWRLVAPREERHWYEAEDHGEALYIRTNDRGANFRLVCAPLSDAGRARWLEVVPHRAEVMLSGVEAFAGHLVLSERQDGLPQLRVLDLTRGEWRSAAFAEPVYTLFPAPNAQWDAQEFRFSYQSPVTPASTCALDLATGATRVLDRVPVPGYDPARYRCERIFAAAPDGTRIPVSLTSRLDTPRDGSAPLLLLGYGAYGVPWPMFFSASRLSLLDRGVVLAVAHVRGGGELGAAWHDAGRMAQKMHTFTDFIAAAEHLVAARYTSPARLVIEGRSAGGLLVGAVLNLRPTLFRAALAAVPFVDVLNTMFDPSLPHTIVEYEEWGNPRVPEEYATLRAYCPYTNLAPAAYPAMLVRGALYDAEVMYWEPAKYVAKLRALKRDGTPLLLVTDLDAGHGGASGRYDALRQQAFDYAFVLWQVGLAGSER